MQYYQSVEIIQQKDVKMSKKIETALEAISRFIASNGDARTIYLQEVASAIEKGEGYEHIKNIMEKADNSHERWKASVRINNILINNKHSDDADARIAALYITAEANHLPQDMVMHFVSMLIEP